MTTTIHEIPALYGVWGCFTLEDLMGVAAFAKQCKTWQ